MTEILALVGAVVVLMTAIGSAVWYVGKERGDLQARIARCETRLDDDEAEIRRLREAVFTTKKTRGD